MRINSILKTACLILAMMSTTGCFSRQSIVKNMFLLEAQQGGQTMKADSDSVLTVQPFSIAPEFQRAGFVYRVDENKYNVDFYNEYLISPSRMITSQTRQWFTISGPFSQVLSPNSIVAPTHSLEAAIQKLYWDVSVPEQPKSVLEITFFLSEKQKREDVIVFSKTYTRTRNINNSTPKTTYVAAQSAALTEILGALEKDLADTLKKGN